MNKTYPYIKQETEKLWSKYKKPKGYFGSFPCKGLKWLPGLSDEEIKEFESFVGFKFNNEVKLFYSTMNGTEDFEYITHDGQTGICSGVYSYPENKEEIKQRLENLKDGRKEIFDFTNVNGRKYGKDVFLLPIFGHRYIEIIPNEESSVVYSSYNDDTIIYGFNLTSYLIEEFLISKF